MKKTKLILISGMSGAGKSTTAQQIAKQYQLNNIPFLWLHEEIDNHPIREGEFSVASRDTEEGMDLNAVQMYQRWANLADEIYNSDRVYIIEGCLYQNIIRYFLHCHYPFEKITQFYDRVMEIIAKLHPTIVFLYRSDIRTSFQQAFAVRGKRWQNLILDPEGEGYFTKHEYKGDESIYAMWEEYQEIANKMFEGYQGNKVKLCTLDGKWEQHIRQLTEYLGLEYKKEESQPLVNPGQYCGRYSVEVEGRQNIIEIKLVNGSLYCQVSFWANMKMIPLGNGEFDLQSFPVRLSFRTNQGKRSVYVGGNYGWMITGKTLWEL